MAIMNSESERTRDVEGVTRCSSVGTRPHWSLNNIAPSFTWPRSSGSSSIPLATGCATGLSSIARAEIARLQRENKELRLERDLLKKATAFCVKESERCVLLGLVARPRRWREFTRAGRSLPGQQDPRDPLHLDDSYGSPRLTHKLGRERCVNHKRVERIVREHAL
jgi:hypothetical protein